MSNNLQELRRAICELFTDVCISAISKDEDDDIYGFSVDTEKTSIGVELVKENEVRITYGVFDDEFGGQNCHINDALDTLIQVVKKNQ